MDTLGEAEAAKIVRYEYACMKAVHAFAREHAIECDSWEGDTVDIIYDEDQWKAAKLAVKEIRKVLGTSDPASVYHFWDTNEAENKFLSPGAFGAVSYEAGSLSPYKFVIGVLRLALEKGLNLQTGTPALSMKASEKGWVVDTSRGVMTAEMVILATNGYTAHLYPALQGVIVPLRGHMTAQRPGTRMPREGLATTYSFIYADGYEYMIPRPQGSTFAGDIMIGGGLTKASQNGLNEFGSTDDTTNDPTIFSYLEKSTQTYFGSNWGDDHPEGRIRKSWTGIMGYSADGFPFVGPVPDEDHLYVAASFQGHGMVLCLLAAKAVVQMITGENLADMERWFPQAFIITKERMKHSFRGRLHTTAPKDLEVKSQPQCT
ncbi:hypothetical protein MMC34_004820 [Xylographa carneopallida]|nr:hypothetical protein [Xylographa carneopallida]